MLFIDNAVLVPWIVIDGGVLELKCWDFQAWKVLEKGICPGEPFKSRGILK